MIVSATSFRNDLPDHLIAIQRGEVVTIQRHRRVVGSMISAVPPGTDATVVSLQTLRKGISAYFDRLAAGAKFQLTKHGRTVGYLIPNLAPATASDPR